MDSAPSTRRRLDGVAVLSLPVRCGQHGRVRTPNSRIDAHTGLQDGSTKAVSAEGCEFGPPGAPPLPIDAMLAYCGQGMVVACPDWKSLCLGIEKNEDGTYTVLTQQVLGAMKADLPAVEGFPFPAVAVGEIPEEAKIEVTLPVEVGTYTMEDGKVKKGLYVGEIRDGVEGAAEPTPAFVEMWKAGPETQGFAGFFKFVGKPLPAPPADDAAAADAPAEIISAAPAE